MPLGFPVAWQLASKAIYVCINQHPLLIQTWTKILEGAYLGERHDDVIYPFSKMHLAFLGYLILNV